MSAERQKILEMLVEGKITPEQADRLLDKLSAGGTGTGSREASPVVPDSGSPKFLRILVENPGEDNVNIRVPIAFMRTGVKLLALLPSKVSATLAAKGIDLSPLEELKGGALDAALQELNVDIEAGAGKNVRIFCE